MIEGQPSDTALMTAVMRAQHFANAPEPKILRDSLALKLTGLTSNAAAAGFMDGIIEKFAELSDPETAKLFMRRNSDAVCMRSRLLEEKLAVARARGLKQLVILGAGLDSTAYRLPDLIDGLDVFEVDHPATQAWKRARLSDAEIPIPDNLRFVEFNFEHQTLAEALSTGGVSPNAMTLFSWLGVHMYLTDDAVKATLNVLGTYPAGSELVMDFVMPDYSHQDGLIPDSVAQLAAVVSQMGEPFKSLYTEDDLDTRLKAAGFSEVTFYSAKKLIEEFMDGNKDAYQMPEQATTLLAARVG